MATIPNKVIEVVARGPQGPQGPQGDPSFPYTGSASISGSLNIDGTVSASLFLGDGSQLTGVSTDTGSFVVTASAIPNGYSTRYTKGDGSTFTVTLSPPQPSPPPIVDNLLEDANLLGNRYLSFTRDDGSFKNLDLLTLNLVKDINIISGLIPPGVPNNLPNTLEVTYGNGFGELLSLSELQYLVTASISNNIISFTKINGNTFNIPIEADSFPYTGSAIISGGLEITGSLNVSEGITGSLLGTASYSNQALTASYLNNLNQNVDIIGDVIIHGTASVDVLITNYQSSSIIYSSGSTKFGDTPDDSHQFTGSVLIEGEVSASTYYGDGSNLTGIEGFPYTGSAEITGSLGVIGNVGIGTTNPSEILHIIGTTNTRAIIETQVNGGSSALRLSAHPNYWEIKNYGASANLGIIRGTSELLTIDNTGNVGIGTTAPSAKLEVKSAAPDTFFADFISSTGSGSAKIYENSNSHPLLYMADAAGTTTVVLNSSGVSYLTGGNIIIGGTADNGNLLQVQGTGYFSGNVGIGTTTPTAKLHIVGSNNLTGTYALKIQNSSSDDLLTIENDGKIYLRNPSHTSGDINSTGSIVHYGDLTLGPVTSNAPDRKLTIGGYDGAQVEFNLHNGWGKPTIEAHYDGTIKYINYGINSTNLAFQFGESVSRQGSMRFYTNSDEAIKFGTNSGYPLAYIGVVEQPNNYNGGLVIKSRNGTTQTNTWTFGRYGDLDAPGNITASGHISASAFFGSVTDITPSNQTASLDCSTGNFFTLTLSSSVDTLLTASNIQPGQSINLRITQPATSGSLSYGPEFKFPNGLPYSVSATSSVEDILSFIAFDSTALYGSSLKNFQ